MSEERKYIGPYKVFKVFKKSGRRSIIERGLTREEAKRIVASYPKNNTSMVCFDKQFTVEKYFIGQ